MTSFDNQAWLAQYANDVPISDLWVPLLRELWGKTRQETQRELRTLTPAHIFTWTQRPQTKKDNLDLDAVRVSLSARYAPASLSRSVRLTSNQCKLLDRTASLAYDRSLDFLTLLEEGKKTDGAASLIQKNPTKQNRYEPLATTFIATRAGVKAIQLKHSRPQLSIRFDGTAGIVVNQKADDEHSKDADIAVFIPLGDEEAKALLVSHKFARIKGGHQDNQWKDAANFLEYGLKARRGSYDIPLLRELAGTLLDREMVPKQFDWEPALVLDGAFFSNARRDMRGQHTTLAGTKAFIGNTDEFVSYLLSLQTP